MELPNPNEVRNDFSRIVENFDSFIIFISTQESILYEEFLDRLHSIKMEITRVWDQINLLLITDKKYRKAFEKLRKIQLKLLIDLDKIEKKYVKRNLISWEYKFQQGKLRKDLIKFFNSISKQMKKIQKTI